MTNDEQGAGMTDYDVPADVERWVAETYTREGQRIWHRAFRDGDEAKRRLMIAMARTESGGT